MLEQLVTTIGVPGILVILIFREVLNYKFKRNGDDRELAIKRDEFEEHKKAVVYKDNCNLIKEFNRQRFDANDKKLDMIDRKLDDVRTLIRNGNNKK